MSRVPLAGEGRAVTTAPKDVRCSRAWTVSLAVAVGALAHVLPATADVLPPERRTVWNPGIPGGVPVRSTVCATVNASTYGNGTVDATAGIQAAINACPVNQVVQLSAGDFLVNGSFPITINKGIVLRGAGPQTTRLRKTSTAANPVILVGERWLQEAASVNLTANAAKGATSVQVTSAAGFSAGQLVVLDETTDDGYVYWGVDPAAAPGGAARGWFTRYNRPVGQMLEIASVSGNSVSFTTPLHIGFDTAHVAQLTRYTIPYGAKNAGVEDLYVRGGQDDNITVRLALYSWVKNVESDWSIGDSVALDSCFRCVLRDSYVHDTPNPNPGGDGYMLSVAHYTADSLVENNIFINGNKVMVMRASGGGNVIGYNYFDNGYIENVPGWMETGLNASHLTCPHFELFEGNQAFNIDGDDTWGGAVYNTFFRNHATGKRRSFADTASRRAIGLMYGHYYYSFVGNVLGTPGQSPAPFSRFAYEDLFPWEDDPVGMWRIGYTPVNWDAAPDARVVSTTHRHGNFDYATNSVRWTTGFDQTLPASLYLTSKPAFFGDNPWPWVDPTGTTRLYVLPARARYDAGTPNGTVRRYLLWSTDNAAQLWRIDGISVTAVTGFGGPGPGWRATSYSRNADGSAQLLWTNNSLAHLWTINANGSFGGAQGFSGPGPGWTATSHFPNGDGSFELLWTTSGLAHIWTINANGSFGSAFGLGGPAAGWTATSYARLADGTHKVLWSTGGLAHVWTITSSFGWGGAIGLGGPTVGWTATSYQPNADGSGQITWTLDNLAQVWTLLGGGGWGGGTSFAGPGSSWRAESYTR